MEGAISLCQFHDNKENIPPFLSISKTTDNKLSARMTLKKKKRKSNHRVPLKDITNLIVDSLIQLPAATSPMFPCLQSRSICKATAGNRNLMEEARCRSLRFGFR
ncbi:unnamed protein product [Lactuca virosa]|uniref:Uncharacterized protein n=1 Tax=Lactuca virosa TaxID=75947 RepID=A0AAU9MBH8_9ASTR|nr:unnamed protein product [Lactuca virosa]